MPEPRSLTAVATELRACLAGEGSATLRRWADELDALDAAGKVHADKLRGWTHPAVGGVECNCENGCPDIRAAADFLDRCADLLIDARLVAAAHAQWADTEVVERG